MITLFQPPSVWGLPSMSPFCVKLETYLRMTGLPYQSKPGNPLQAPKGKVPYIKIEGKTLGDSAQIIEFLKKKHGDPLDQHFNAQERARGLTIQRLVEEHLYFAGVWFRWSSPESLPHVRKVFLDFLPPVIGRLIFRKIRKDMAALTHAQGMGRHSAQEILDFAKEDVNALSALLGENPFFLGSQPSSVDASVYGMLVQLLHVPWDSELKRYVAGIPNLVAFDRRMKEKYWT